MLHDRSGLDGRLHCTADLLARDKCRLMPCVCVTLTPTLAAGAPTLTTLAMCPWWICSACANAADPTSQHCKSNSHVTRLSAEAMIKVQGEGQLSHQPRDLLARTEPQEPATVQSNDQQTRREKGGF